MPSPAAARACAQACSPASNHVMSCRDIGNRSLAWAQARMRSELARFRPRSSFRGTSAATPSDKGEQSVRRKGAAINDPGQRLGLVAVALEIRLGDAGEHAREPRRDVRLLAAVAAPSRWSPALEPVVPLIVSTPITSAKRPSPAARKWRAANSAALPDTQAFSHRVAGFNRSSGTDCIASNAAKSCFEKPLLKVPTNTASTSDGSIPASAMAPPATLATKSSTSRFGYLPNCEHAQPTIGCLITGCSVRAMTPKP